MPKVLKRLLHEMQKERFHCAAKPCGLSDRLLHGNATTVLTSLGIETDTVASNPNAVPTGLR